MKQGQPRAQLALVKLALGIGSPTPGWRKSGKANVGSGVARGIELIKTKLVSVRDMEAKTLHAYLRQNQELCCIYKNTANDSYALLSVSTECSEVDVVYNPKIWLEGTFVRRYYEVCKATIGANGAATARALSIPAVQYSMN